MSIKLTFNRQKRMFIYMHTTLLNPDCTPKQEDNRKKHNHLQPMLRKLMPISTSEVCYPAHGIMSIPENSS